MSVTILTISHYLFLTREQRYALALPETEIDVVGTCSPMWMKNGTHQFKNSEEIFAKYRLRHCPQPEKQTVNFTDEGFFIRFSPVMPPYLLDYKDNGSMFLNLTHKNFLKRKGKTFTVIHFLIIEDMDALKGTLTFVNNT